jgi:hypothetical protein
VSLRPVSLPPRTRLVIGALALAAAFFCFVYGFAFTAIGFVLASSLTLAGASAMRAASPAKPGNTSARTHAPDRQWIRDPTNLNSPYGDYDPPSQ